VSIGSGDVWSGLAQREVEAEAIGAALADTTRGRGRFVILYGQSGTGRTSLLAAAVAKAESDGTGVLEASGSELERGYGFGVVRQLLEVRVARLTVAERRSLLGHAGPAAGSALGIGRWNDAAPSVGFDHLEALYRLIARFAASGPLVVAVDDVQWCDRPSLDFLCFLGHRAAQLPVTVIGAWRRGEPGVRAGRLQALAALPQTSFLTLSPLDRDGVRSVLRCDSGVDPAQRVVDVVHEQTAGNPFLVRELSDALRLRGVSVVSPWDDAIEWLTPESVRRNVVARLGRHAEPVRRLARAVAVLREGSIGQAAALAGIDRDAARTAVDALVRAGVFRDDATVAYAQPLVQRAVCDTLSLLERAELHREAADVLCDEPADFERAAVHLLRCEPTGSPRFAEALVYAGRRAFEEGRLDDARRLYERALDEAQGNELHAKALVELAAVELRLGAFTAAAAHGAAALDVLAAPADRVAATSVRAEALAGGSDWRAALVLLETAADAIAADEPELALGLRADAAALRACAGAAGAIAPADVQGLSGATAAERKLLAAGAYELAVSGDATADQVNEICRRALSSDTTPAAGLFEHCARHLARSAALLSDRPELVEECRGTTEAAADASELALRSRLAFAKGDVFAADGAARLGLDSIESMPPSPLRDQVVRTLLVTLALTGIERGRPEEAHAAVEQLVAVEEETCPEVLLVRLALGLAQGVPALEAAVEVESSPDRIVAPGFSLRACCALTRHAAGARPRALALADRHLERARAWGGPTVLGRALVIRGVVAVGAERARFLQEGVAVLERSPSRLELARALVELGAVLRRSGRRRECRAQLERGADLAQLCGAAVLASRARAELVSAGARPRRKAFSGLDALTFAERRVALLAANGMTKRQIADELTVSVKTVSGQLGAVYSKLDVHDRVALAAAMHGAESRT
jgi:DNA-binding CsgD family transcriptional regulator